MSKRKDKEVLDDDLTESIESPPASNDLVLIIIIGMIGLFILIHILSLSPLSSLLSIDKIHLMFLSFILIILFLWMIFNPIYHLINNEVYIFTPNYILITSRLFKDKRIDNIKGYEYHERYHSEKRKDGRMETDVSGILFLHHKNGILELYPGLIGNFFTIKNFIRN